MKTKKLTMRTAALTLAVVVVLGLLVNAFAVYDTPTFKDVPPNFWGYSYIEQAAEKGWVSGVGGGYFEPNGQVTYAQMATMLTRAFFQDDLKAYNGPTNQWFLMYCNTADKLGLFKGTNFTGTQYNTPMSRYEMAQMLPRAILARGIEVAPDYTAAKNSTADWDSIPPKYWPAVAVTKAAKIINGMDPQGTFGGTGNMTRAQACVVLIKLDEYIANNGGNNPGNPDKPGDGGNTGDQGTTGKDANGNTLAAGVKTSVGKSDSYPTKGRTETPNQNGYYTAASVDIGDAKLVYELLDLVNEARRAEGLNELTWVPTDALEEYTLLRAMELTTLYSHDRPNDYYSYSSEVIAGGGRSANAVFDAWMNSSGHRKELMSSAMTYMCGAACGNKWVIVLSTDSGAELAEMGSEVNFETYNGRYTNHYWK